MTVSEKRIELGNRLKEILGSNNVYFEPPESYKISYPCFVYKRSGGNTNYADNSLYRFKAKYTITHIRKKPDEDLIEEMLTELSNISYERSFSTDNLYHDVFVTYY